MLTFSLIAAMLWTSLITLPEIAPVAQLDRASDYGSEGREFESSRARDWNRNVKAFRFFIV